MIYVVPWEKVDIRLDILLTTIAPEYSRSYWQKQCVAGLVLVNGVAEKSRSRTLRGR
jgi:hypothetical protein